MKIFIYLFIFFIMITLFLYNFYSFPNESIIIPNKIQLELPKVDNVTDFDYKNIYDPLTAPTYRPPRYEIDYHFSEPIYTRGYPDNFYLFGYLLNPTDKNDILKLFGREKYPNSDQYEYYAIKHNGHDSVKMDLKDYKKELYDNDVVLVPMLNTNYNVVKNPSRDIIRYDPLIF